MSLGSVDAGGFVCLYHRHVADKLFVYANVYGREEERISSVVFCWAAAWWRTPGRNAIIQLPAHAIPKQSAHSVQYSARLPLLERMAALLPPFANNGDSARESRT